MKNKYFTEGIIVILLLALSLPYIIYSQNTLESVNIEISYDPVSGFGVVVQEFTLSMEVSGQALEITVPLLDGDNIIVVNVTNADGEPVLYDYDAEDNTLTVLINNTSSFTVYYLINDILYEEAPLTYSGILNFTKYTWLEITAKLRIMGNYDVITVPETNYYYDGEDTIIEFNAPEAYIVTLIQQPEEIPPPTTTTQPLETTTTTTTIAGETTPPITTATETQRTGTETTGGEEQPGLAGTSLFLVALIVIVVLIGIIVFVMKK